MMNSYEEKLEAKRERLLNAADNADARSNAAYNAGRAAVEDIPFGQPILVGHHSESKHRNAIARSNRNMDKSVAESKKADYLRNKAAGVGTGGISSDDPEALVKLKNKLSNLEKSQEIMKASNKIIRNKKLSDEEKVAKLIEAGLSDSNATEILKPDFAGRIGFASYSLSNNNANMKTVRDRIAVLESKQKAYEAAGGENIELERNGIKLVQNFEENRFQLIFPGKPDDETRRKLKSNGFRWAPSKKAWQRNLNNRSLYIAKALFDELTKDES